MLSSLEHIYSAAWANSLVLQQFISLGLQNTLGLNVLFLLQYVFPYTDLPAIDLIISFSQVWEQGRLSFGKH